MLDVIESGSFFGYDTILHTGEYSDSAEAIETSIVHFISKSEFVEVLGSDSRVASTFIDMLSETSNKHKEELLNLAYSSIRQRVATALLSLISANKAANLVHARRDLIANMVGTSTESAIRTLSDFKKEGLIRADGRIIEILDIGRLNMIKQY